MSTIPRPQPLYLETTPDPTFVTYHPAAASKVRDTSVMLCPPFGFDEVSSYRSLRTWAMRLAADGYPVLRLSFPGTGDSGGDPRDPDRLGTWASAAHAGATFLKRNSGCARVAAIGIGLGAIVVRLAVGDGAPIDDLVMWGAPARGSSFLRQLRAFSKLERSLFYENLPDPPAPPEGEIEAGGFVLSAQTVQALGALDLTQLPLPAWPRRRVLLLERDGLAVDRDLRAHFEEAEVELLVAPGEGYAAMTSDPQAAVEPEGVIQYVGGWLGESAALVAGRSSELEDPVDGATSTADLSPGLTSVTETPLYISRPSADLAGVLVEPAQRPAHGLCLVLLNAGAVRRIGPDRMWVQAARGWAQRGVPTLRLDVEGIGDAGGDGRPYRDDAALYVPGLVPQVIAALDDLQKRGLGDRFIVGGLCAGAYWSFHAALIDPRVQAALMLNPRALVWDTGLEPARDLRVLLHERPSLSKIRRVATAARLRALARWLFSSPLRWLRAPIAQRPAPLINDEVKRLLDRLLASEKRALILFSDHEPLQRELADSGQLARLQSSPNMTVEYVAVHDHTLRPGWAQRQALAALDRTVERELTADGALTA
ncbi:MAG: alpha/beta fold hydrolase [Solirubrobacteraceae bacterium]